MTSDIRNLTSAFWHPDEFARRKNNLALRQRVIAALRNYFARTDFAEVETPILQRAPGGEVHLQAFATELKNPQGAAQKLYLHTSPEFAMKKLLVAGLPRIYQLTHCFRNNERSSLHHPEFLMCEWYRSCHPREGGDPDDALTAIKQDCIKLVRSAAEAGKKKTFSMNNIICDPFEQWETLTVAEAFKRYADIDILATANDAIKLTKETKRIGLRVTDKDTWDDLFFRIMGEKIEPHLGKTRPTFLCDYPISMAALARVNPNDPRTAERFELYICGIELANAFTELTDADEQSRRLTADMALKQKLYGETWPVDEDFIAALRHGLPACAGIALGVDRLVMLCAGAETIDDILWAPVSP